MFACKYGWTKEQVLELTPSEVQGLLNIIDNEHKQQQAAIQQAEARVRR